MAQPALETPRPTCPTVTRTGYQNFGSFFTENVEDMIAVPREAYVQPVCPFPPPSVTYATQLDFGEACRQLFMIDFNRWTFINHGAFGAVCRAAHEEANLWREHCETQPLRFLDRELFPHMVRVMREMADFIGADPRDLVFVPNATTGLNVAIQAAGLRPGDTMYMLNIGYGSVKKMAQAASAAAAGRGAGTDGSGASAVGGADGEAPGGIHVVYGEVTFPISGPQDIVDLVDRTLPPGTRLAVFDSVTSNTALVLPVRELTRLCRSRGAQVLIDGAHALGQLHLDLRRGVCGGVGEDCDFGARTESDAATAAASQAEAARCGRPDVHGSGRAASSRPPPSSAAAGTDVGAVGAEAAGAGGRQGGESETGTGAPRLDPGKVDEAVAEAVAVAVAVADDADDAELYVPDYFVTNCHKWLCAPRGSAVLWVAPRRQACVRPLVVSHGSGCGFTSDFIWDGCRDYAPYLATSSALALWRSWGPQRIRAYCRSLLASAAGLLVDRWGTGLLAPSLESMCANMALVELPPGLAESSPATSTDAKYVQDLLHHVHAVECPVKCIQGRLYVRISVHVYNTLRDYERLAEAVDSVMAATRASEAVAAGKPVAAAAGEAAAEPAEEEEQAEATAEQPVAAEAEAGST